MNTVTEVQIVEQRTLWLSFCDLDRPKGEQFLGVIVVDVTRDMADAALEAMPWMFDKDDGPWLCAAAKACWDAGVNPGGEVMSMQLPDGGPRYPLLTLLDKATIDAIDKSFVQ